ncbi:hypothetical protein QA641_37150 [Bradyrhizobium sp. CB1650]|uniref:hypothetical protein n=1 Tax=Bradyrhizobium sp. CB1650 TaxID=3039153 RepID=UPI0024353541|nr:hypothetical protein [Bradyrhizobium sp. CB1650]WGD51108.1 hypothetical protein QA641_37150 [Bradyrhizobium sp. CB1650]
MLATRSECLRSEKASDEQIAFVMRANLLEGDAIRFDGFLIKVRADHKMEHKLRSGAKFSNYSYQATFLEIGHYATTK